MNDPKFCDELLDELENAGKALGPDPAGAILDFYKKWKELDLTIRGLKKFAIRRHDRKTAKQMLMSASPVAPVDRAKMIAIIRTLPELINFCTREIGRPFTGGMSAKLSHEEKLEIRAKIAKLKTPNTRITEIVRDVAKSKGISSSLVWEIIHEAQGSDEMKPEYWEKELRREALSSETGREQTVARENSDEEER